MTLTEHISLMADYIQFIADKFFTHPDPVARLHAASMALDREIIERMKDMELKTKQRGTS